MLISFNDSRLFSLRIYKLFFFGISEIFGEIFNVFVLIILLCDTKVTFITKSIMSKFILVDFERISHFKAIEQYSAFLARGNL